MAEHERAGDTPLRDIIRTLDRVVMVQENAEKQRQNDIALWKQTRDDDMVVMKEGFKKFEDFAKALIPLDGLGKEQQRLDKELSNLRHYVRDRDMGPAVEMLQMKMSEMETCMGKIQTKQEGHHEYIIEHKQQVHEGMADLRNCEANVKVHEGAIKALQDAQKIKDSNKEVLVNSARALWGPVRYVSAAVVGIIGWLVFQYIELKTGVKLWGN